MHNITVTYETVVTKKLSLDIDQVIDLVVEDTKKDADGEEMSLFDLQCVFGDNMNYYLEKLGLIKDSGSCQTMQKMRYLKNLLVE